MKVFSLAVGIKNKQESMRVLIACNPFIFLPKKRFVKLFKNQDTDIFLFNKIYQCYHMCVY